MQRKYVALIGFPSVAVKHFNEVQQRWIRNKEDQTYYKQVNENQDARGIKFDDVILYHDLSMNTQRELDRIMQTIKLNQQH